jgi:hypothetical protein
MSSVYHTSALHVAIKLHRTYGCENFCSKLDIRTFGNSRSVPVTE